MVKQTEQYIPQRGDLVYLDFDPTRGHEQRGHRPAFVISPLIYNQKTSLALVMPITKHKKGYPFEVILPVDLKIQGVILVDPPIQIRSATPRTFLKNIKSTIYYCYKTKE